MPNIGMDAEIDRKEHREVEKFLNAHGISWIILLAEGHFIGHKDRIKDNMRARNCAASPLHGLHKNLKIYEFEVVCLP